MARNKSWHVGGALVAKHGFTDRNGFGLIEMDSIVESFFAASIENSIVGKLE